MQEEAGTGKRKRMRKFLGDITEVDSIEGVTRWVYFGKNTRELQRLRHF